MKILFFAPHSAIWAHAFPEALVAEALAQSGHDIVYVTCGNALQDQCVAMQAVGLDYRSNLAQRKHICDRCKANKSVLRRHFGLKGYDLADMLLGEERAQIDKLVADLSDGNFLAFEIDGVPVGRYSLYELILQRKKNDLQLTEDDWAEYKASVRGALTALFAGRRILEREKPERVVTYNSLYAVNRVFSRLAELRGAIPYFMHAGGNLSRRLQTLMIGGDYSLRFFKELIVQWPRFANQPCSRTLVRQITEHFLVLFSGQSVFGYSSTAGKPLDMRKAFGVQDHQRLLVATMSSPDERDCVST